MNRRPAFWLALGLGALFLGACEHHHDDSHGTFVNANGTWNGTFDATGVSGSSVTVTIVQTGNAFNGQYTLNVSTRTGTILGTVDGNSLSFKMTPAGPCTGSFSADAAVQADRMTLYFTGSDCVGPLTDAIGDLRKS